jgi:hypothetical protein
LRAPESAKLININCQNFDKIYLFLPQIVVDKHIEFVDKDDELIEILEREVHHPERQNSIVGPVGPTGRHAQIIPKMRNSAVYKFKIDAYFGELPSVAQMSINGDLVVNSMKIVKK